MTLTDLYQHYTFLKTKGNKERAQRGFAFEKLLSELFKLEQIQIKDSFRSGIGQVDGAIIHNNTIYHVEAKWQAKKQTLADIAAFQVKVNNTLEGTKGLVISISGFSKKGIDLLKTGGKPNIIFWTGDFMEAILSGRITATELLDLSHKYASIYGEFLLSNERIEAYYKERKNKLPATMFYKANFSAIINDRIKTFGGRDKELKEVNTFLERGAGGYLLIEGLSGYGKTSFLANLVNKESDYLYHFFSQSYNTGGFFTSVSEKEFLRNMLEQFPDSDKTAISQLQDEDLRPAFIGSLAAYTGKKLVMVLDAIDEIEATVNFLKGLLPKPIPPAVYIILSSRTASESETIEKDYFLTAAGLQRQDINKTITLTGLTIDNLRDIIDNMNSQAPERMITLSPAALTQIATVTEGDPFYVRFLLEDLQEERLSVKDLSTLPKGVEHYLDDQFAQLSRSMKGEYNTHREIIIANIVYSRHPIPKTSLIKLVNTFLEEKGQGNKPSMTWGNMEEVIAPVRRFLLSIDDSYTFCHKRFREYFLRKIR